jgi:3-oxoacyl-[acyl-carrier-protein] synthase II
LPPVVGLSYENWVRRIGIYGWGIVAPQCANVREFELKLGEGGSWLSPFEGFGPSNFLVGQPKFDFAAYRPWLDARFPANRFNQLCDKMDATTLFGIGAFIQCIESNPKLEAALSDPDNRAQVCVGTGLGAIPTISRISVDYHRAERRWNRYFSQPERNAALAAHLSGSRVVEGCPPDPTTVRDPDDRELAEDVWFAFWAPHSEALHDYVAKLREISTVKLEGSIESAKMGALRDMQRRLARFKEEQGAPEPPWAQVSPNLLWNIANTPSAQISMLGKIRGVSFAPVAACSTFGVSLKLGMDAIRRGEARLAVIGACDPPPHPLTVGAFSNARVVAADGAVSKPLTRLAGTHVAGGAAIWVIGDREVCESLGLTPLGLEPVTVGLSSDADHIITPSKDGPQQAIHNALRAAELAPEDLATWDLHATATPGDYQEVKNLREILPPSVLISARKGTFGHGMGPCGGWELTAQYLGLAQGKVFPTALQREELHAELRHLHENYVFDSSVSVSGRYAGKLSMGVGGVNSCVISRRWD